MRSQVEPQISVVAANDSTSAGLACGGGSGSARATDQPLAKAAAKAVMPASGVSQATTKRASFEPAAPQS